MKKYLIKLPVYETIEIEIETDENNQEKIIELAKEKAIETVEKVYWLFDEEQDINVELITI